MAHRDIRKVRRDKTRYVVIYARYTVIYAKYVMRDGFCYEIYIRVCLVHSSVAAGQDVHSILLSQNVTHYILRDKT